MSNQPVYEIDPHKVVVQEGRQRQKLDLNSLKQLRNSIEKLGQLQPGVCSEEGERIILIAGYRRLRACIELDQSYKYILLDEIPDPVKRKEMELHENLLRENLTFLEEAQAKAELHKLYMEQTKDLPKRRGHAAWSIEQTAAQLHVSKGNLTEDMELAKYAKAIPEVKRASSKTEAKKIMKRIKQGVIQSEALKQAVEKAKEKTQDATCEEDSQSSVQSDLACLIQEYSSRVFCGRFEDNLEAAMSEGRPFEIVFFDPPWGVDFDSVGRLSGGKKAYADSRKDFLRELRKWLSMIYSAMSEDSHLYMKFGIVHHQIVYSMLKRAGFQVNKMPIIWVKKGAHATRQPEVWPGRCYEPIAFARKGNKRLVRTGAPDLIPTPPPSPKMKDIHPSAMHPALPRELLLRSAMPGDRVLDPMAGSGMLGVAAESLKSSHQLDYVLIEKDKNFCDLAVKNLIKGYDRIVGEAALDNENEGKDYKNVTPGGPEWQEIWNNHPELRKEMVEWRGGKE